MPGPDAIQVKRRCCRDIAKGAEYHLTPTGDIAKGAEYHLTPTARRPIDSVSWRARRLSA